MKIVKRSSKKYPLKVELDNGKKLIIPKQSAFSNDWLRHHGCSLVAEYIALQWLGIPKQWPIHLLKWHKKHTPNEIYAKVTLRGVEKGIDAISGKDAAKYYKKVTAGRIQKAMDKGHLVIMEQKNPIHSIVLLPDKGDCYMASHGRVKRISVKEIAKTATSNSRYRGMIVVK